MKKIILFFHFAIAILMHNAIHGMEAIELDFYKKKGEFNDAYGTIELYNNPTKTKGKLKRTIRYGAAYFTAKEEKPVKLEEYLYFHTRVKTAHEALAKKRKGKTRPVNAKLLAKFNEAVKKISEDDKENSKKVLNLGAKLLAQGASFEEIHPQIKAAGNILRGNIKQPNIITEKDII